MQEQEKRQLGVTAGRETYINFERVSTETLLADNQSIEAYKKRAEWEQNRARRELTLLDTCSDSRIVTPNPTQSVVIRSIAAGRDLEPFSPLLNHPSVKDIHILGHHAGTEALEGEPPKGCGGLAVREKQLNGKPPMSGVERWVSKYVCHSDSLLVALDKTRDALRYTDKDILLSTQDHLDHTVYPMRLMRNTDLGLENYDPANVYRNGIPVLPSEQIDNSPFGQYIKNYYENQFPDLYFFSEHSRKTQEVQNPHLLLVTTNIRPPEVCLPNTTRKPNSVFVETLARLKNRQMGDRVEIRKKDIEEIIDQAQYPISNFPDLSAVYIETGDLEQSRRVADSFIQRQWFIDWYNEGNRKIIVGSIKSGIIREISNFKPELSY